MTVPAPNKGGRPRKHASNAARVAAWRAKHRVSLQAPRYEGTIVPPTNDSQESWNRYLAKQGLGVSSGKYMADAPSKRGLLHCGGNDTVGQFEYLEGREYQRKLGKFSRTGHGPDPSEKISDGE